MADYRLYISKRQQEIKDEIQELEAENERLSSAARVLDEADEDERSDAPDSGMGKATNAILAYLRANSSMATTEIRNRLGSDHGISKQNTYSTLHRLKKRGLIEKTGRMSWRLKKKKPASSPASRDAAQVLPGSSLGSIPKIGTGLGAR